MSSQAATSATNFLLSLALLHATTTRQFGVISLAVALYQFAVSTARAVGGDVYVLRHDSSDVDADAASAGRCRIRVLIVAAVAALGTASIVPSARAEGVVWAILLMVVALPVVLLEDFYRSYFVARGEPVWAASIDGVWLICLAVGFMVAMAGGALAPASAVGVWAFGALIAVAVGKRVDGRAVPERKVGASYRRLGGPPVASSASSTESAVARQLLLDHAFSASGLYFAIAAVTVVNGIEDIAAMRAALVVAGPIMLAFQAAQMYSTAELRRAVSRRHLLRRRVPLRLAALLIAVVNGTIAALLITPDFLVAAVFSEKWDLAEPLLPAVAAYLTVEAIFLASRCALRALEAPSEVAKARRRALPITLCSTAIGTALVGPAGAIVGLTLGSAVSCVLTWRTLLARLAP